MRLIDYDNLRDELGAEVLMEEVDEDNTIDDIIAKVPTIDAIPIEWIEEWEAKYTEGEYSFELITDLIEDWRKANEKNNI